MIFIDYARIKMHCDGEIHMIYQVKSIVILSIFTTLAINIFLLEFLRNSGKITGATVGRALPPDRHVLSLQICEAN